MNVEVIKENLIVNGNLLTGEDGKLYATGEISWRWRDGGAEYIERFNEKTGLHIPNDYDIQGKTVIVLGSVYILDDIIREEKGDWVVSAGNTEDELEKLGLGQLL